MPEKKIKLRLNSSELSLLYWIMFLSPVLLYALVLIYISGISGVWKDFKNIDSYYFIATLIMIYIIHELLHVFGGLLAGANLKSFDFGFDKTSLSITCGCNDEMSVKGFRLFIIMPFIVLTPVFLSLALSNNSYPWWLILALSTSGCAYDITLFAGLCGIPNKTRVVPELSGENGHVYLKSA